MEHLYSALTWVMNGCYSLCNNYGLAIVLFTFLSKIVLLPVSLWTYMNSITMIKIQPDINLLKIKYYGQKDIIAEEQAKLFKEKKYHPLASTIPLIIQLVLLMGVVSAVRAGIDNPVIDMTFGPIDLGLIPSQTGVELIWSPIVAGVAAWILCVAQNASNILQSEQSKYNKYGTMILSVVLSLYLGWYVPIGTAFYWVCSNLMAVLQLYILNWIIKPRKYVDYEKLNKSRKTLVELQNIGKKKKESFFSENKKRERRDYKRFFSIVNKHLVFYSESNGFYKYFKGFIEYLLEHTNITIHYITSDANDDIFKKEKENPQIKAYYIGENRLITLMMKMDADIVVMTMPDLDNFHIKRSYIRDDIEYIYVQHDMGGTNMGMRKGSLNHFDTIFCSGPHQISEIRETEEVYDLPAKELVKVGYPLIDEIKEKYDSVEHGENAIKKILIAPSWQEDNILDTCLEELLDALKDRNYNIIVRPHPQEVRLKREYMESVRQKYESEHVIVQTDFTSNNPVMEADMVITDWSGISWEYSFTTKRPVLFIDTPMKVLNPEYQRIKTVPLSVQLRDKIGKSIKLDQLGKAAEYVEFLMNHKEEYQEQITRLAETYIFNLGSSAEAGADYIIKSLQEKLSRKGEGEK